MAKSRIGPFALEAPLSASKPAGQVFRGIHLEQKKLAALRVFQIPMGMTPESRQDYADQLEQLKNLRHPGIVRCFGGGFDTRNAYLAYQLVDGVSLDAMVRRRDRLPWETALEHSQQIAEALQHAHERGWIHARLKPDKVLISSDGSTKINDWRREAISFVLGERQPSDAQLMFSAPEVFNGQSPDEKSDLYSLGAVMYFMLTGHPPFMGEGEQLKQVVLTTPAPEVGRSVMDCPVWLSAIVAQLLAKDPQQRPYSMAALLLAFREAEKRAAQGVGVLQHATAGFSPLQLKADRDEAEKVLGIKPKKKKRKVSADSSFFDQVWVLALGLIAAVGAIVWFLLPLSESALRDRAEALLPPVTEEWRDWSNAKKDYLDPLIERFPDGPNSEWARSQIAWIDARGTERRLEREDRRNLKSKWTDAERQYWAARGFEQFGDYPTAADKYRAVVKLYEQDPQSASICILSQEGLERIRESAKNGSPLQDFLTSKLEDASKAYEGNDFREARAILNSIVELYAEDPQVAPQVTDAQKRLEEISGR